ncbi:MAG: YlmC/YmxH family sporulation protein [Clostridia bacterium]|nr:YlmC/YmxH family sporulation protein [Clostridia bacterium]
MARCTLSQLKEKEVINVCDGRRLGCVEDIEFEIDSGRICALLLSERGGILGFGKGEPLSLPWSAIKRIGPDIILVDIGEEPAACCEGEPDRPKPPKPQKRGFFG